MKKFKELLARGKRQDNFYSFCDASLCEDVNYTISPKNIYKYFKFDSDCSDLSEIECEISFDSRVDLHTTEASTTCSLSDSDNVALPLTEVFESQLGNKFESKESHSTNSGSFTSFYETFSSGTCEEISSRSEEKRKSRKNLYMINISNSRCFHIGSQKTVNITEQECYESQSDVNDFIPQLKFKLNEILDYEEKLNEESIMLISVHLNNQWKEFVKYLGLEESVLEELHSRNDNNRNLTVYDALQNFLHKFPNTSFGFIINGLNQISEISIIKKLMKELKV